MQGWPMLPVGVPPQYQSGPAPIASPTGPRRASIVSSGDPVINGMAMQPKEGTFVTAPAPAPMYVPVAQQQPGAYAPPPPQFAPPPQIRRTSLVTAVEEAVPVQPMFTAPPQQERRPSLPSAPQATNVPVANTTNTSSGKDTVGAKEKQQPMSSYVLNSMKVYLRHVGASISEEDVRDFALTYGPVRTVELQREKGGTTRCCYVTFENPASAINCVKSANGSIHFASLAAERGESAHLPPLSIRMAESLEERHERLTRRSSNPSGKMPPAYDAATAQFAPPPPPAPQVAPPASLHQQHVPVPMVAPPPPPPAAMAPVAQQGAQQPTIVYVVVPPTQQAPQQHQQY